MGMQRKAIGLLVLFGCGMKGDPVASGAQPVAAKSTAESSPRNSEAVEGVEHPELRKLLDDQWEHMMASYPLWATVLGDHRFDDKLADVSSEAWLAGEERGRAFSERAVALTGAEMSAQDSVTLQLFSEWMESGVNTSQCEFWKWSVSPRNNPFVSAMSLPDTHRIVDQGDGENLLARYRALSGSITHELENLRAGLKEEKVANAHSVQLVIEMMTEALARPIESSPLYAPVIKERPEWGEERLVQWRLELRQTLVEQIRPAFHSFLQFLKEELLPNARGAEKSGVMHLPQGPGCYQALVRKYTTLNRTAEEIHQLGLSEIASVHEEFKVLGERVFGTRDLKKIFERLRTDETLFFKDEAEVKAKAESALAAAEKEMPKWFGRLPKAKCTVTPIPDHEAPYTTIAYYSQPHLDGSKGGEYYINLYQPTTRPKHEAEVLAYHESIPGHHLQIAIAQELPNLPAFRKHVGYTAFIEGWALYTERLSEEMGLYTSDVDRLGMLSFDAWRGSRLVVDTGIHAKGWTRAQAEAYLQENTPLAPNNIRNEVDRYITTPGQALAYKTGQIEIIALRKEAESALKGKFNIAEFHDVLLGGGAVSLPVLRRRVEEWVASGL